MLSGFKRLVGRMEEADTTDSHRVGARDVEDLQGQ